MMGNLSVPPRYGEMAERLKAPDSKSNETSNRSYCNKKQLSRNNLPHDKRAYRD
jgi:hypothetical protein